MPALRAIVATVCAARTAIGRTSIVLGDELLDARVQPADLQQVAEQRLEPVQLVDQQLGGAGEAGRELLAGGVQHVRGHPHGGQRRAQLVGDVRGEPALQRAELLELADLALDALGHLVVRLGEPGDVVLADHDHAFVQLAAGEPLRGLRGAADRPDDLPGHEVRDAGEQQQQHETADDQRALHDADRGCSAVSGNSM